MNSEACRISFTNKLQADENTFQIAIYDVFDTSRKHKNLFTVIDSDEIYDKLYLIMEKFDSFESFSIYCDDIFEISKFLEFLRQENPKKTINVYCFDPKTSTSEENDFSDFISNLMFI